MSKSTVPSCFDSLSAPAPDHIAVHARADLLERFAELQSRCIDPDTFNGEDFELWHALDDHARYGDGVLDLRTHGEALRRVPAELMEAFFDVCRCRAPALQAMYLPSGLGIGAVWLDACPDGVLIVQEAVSPA